jgi:hypothetical protein
MLALIFSRKFTHFKKEGQGDFMLKAGNQYYLG